MAQGLGQFMLNLLFNFTPLKLLTEFLWRDEAFSYFMARQSIKDILLTTALDNNPPLYYILLHYWIKIFGQSAFALRCLSLIFFTLMIYMIFLFVKHITKKNDRQIEIFLILIIFNPFLLYFGFEARMYSLFALLTVSSYYYLIKQNKLRSILINVLGLYTHYFFTLVLLSQLIYSMIFDRQRFKNVLKSVILSFVLALPWFLFIYNRILSNTKTFWAKPTHIEDLFNSLAILYTGYEAEYYNYYDRYLMLLSLVLSVVLLFCLRRVKINKITKMLLVWSFLFYFLFLIISIFKPVFVPRYLIFAACGFNILIIYLLLRMNSKFSLLFIGLILVLYLHYWRALILYRPKAHEVKTINEIKNIAGKQDLLYLTDPILYFTARYYFDENRIYLYNLNPKKSQSYYGTVLIPRDKFINMLPEYPVKAFIMTSEDKFTIETSL